MDTQETFGTVHYDLPSENISQLKPVKEYKKIKEKLKEGEELDDKEIEIHKEEEKKAGIRKELHDMRIGFFNNLCELGTGVSSSVFIYPEKNTRKVETLITKTEKAYENFFKKYSEINHRNPYIGTLKFHQTETEPLRIKADDALHQDMQKLHDEIDRLQQRQLNSKTTKGISPRTRKKYECLTKSLETLFKDFKLHDKKVQAHIDLINAKIETLEVKE